MESLTTVTSFFVFLCITGVELVDSSYTKYNTDSVIVEGKLNVHLVPHSHDDVGWLKTVDQYYLGLNNSIQGACVRNVLDSVVSSLLRDSNRKFIFSEQAFFQRWWAEQNVETQDEVRKLVDMGQLEFVNGGWCMHDEAGTHYIDMIDQTTLGHRMIKQQFNKTPRAGWQIDPFGHSAVQAYLLGAELGFDSLHFARIDYQDRAKRKEDKSLEVIWRGSKTFGSSSQIFANTFPIHYSPPNKFHFEVFEDSLPIQDSPHLYDYNVEQRVYDFIDAAMTQENVTRTNHIMWTMGDDFQYQYAESWFKQMDKLIHYVNKDGRVNALYSTPSIYTDAKNAANGGWPLKTDDYFPYADYPHSYYTGYFSSRPALKRYIRMLSGYYLAEAVINSALSCLTNSSSNKDCAVPAAKFRQCLLMNITYCPPTEEAISEGKSLVVVVYNSLGWIRTDIVRIPVSDANLAVHDSKGQKIQIQYVGIDNATSDLRSYYTKAYLGTLPKQDPKYWLLFQASVPPLGWSTYFVSKGGRRGRYKSQYLSAMAAPQTETVEVGPGDLKMYFSSTSGHVKRMRNLKAGVDIPIQQSYLWYGSSSGGMDSKASGAYIFRPNGAPPVPVSRLVPLKIIQGPLVDEVHQQFSTWIYQVIRLYKDKEHAEVEFTIGPVPLEDGIGKEVITRLTANMVTENTFYTDSNGRDFLKRVRDYREDWSLSVNEPVAGNYYPLNLGIFASDKKFEFSLLVDRATGGASIKDGELELMLHRRMIYDDSRGVVGSLDETVCVENTCEGLKVRGNYYMSIHELGAGARWRRTTGQQVYSPFLLAFTHEKMENWIASDVTSATAMDPTYSLPPNVALITLQELDDGNVLLRLAHLYEAGEDVEFSAMAKVELKKLFGKRMIIEVKETSLSSNQDKSEMKKMEWKVEGESKEEPGPLRGGPVDNSNFIVELGPMEIRTFLLNSSAH